MQFVYSSSYSMCHRPYPSRQQSHSPLGDMQVLLFPQMAAFPLIIDSLHFLISSLARQVSIMEIGWLFMLHLTIHLVLVTQTPT